MKKNIHKVHESAPNYSISFAPRIKKQLKLIPEKTLNLILDRIKNLEKDPQPHGVEPIEGSKENLFRIRQGDYRIVYQIKDDALIILVLRVVHRKEVYKKKALYQRLIMS